jgi:UDP-3-O-[3-hydroxymyristoyl] glucosamine N-acyltransferase
MKKEMTLEQVAQWMNGRVVGNSQLLVSAPEKIELAQKQHLAFFANEKYLPFVASTQAGGIVVSEGFPCENYTHQNFVVVDSAYARFSALLEHFQGEVNRKSGIHPLAHVDATAEVHPSAWIDAFAVVSAQVKIGSGCQIGPHVWIGPAVEIGENSLLFSGVKVYEQCHIGSEVIIHSNSVLGSDGFGFAPQADGTYRKVPQTGNVVVGNRVEIGANCVIDRAMMGSTVLKDGVKLDNLVQVAHNVVIGENTVIAAQTGISGSAVLGKNMVVGGQAGFAGHIQVADRTTVGAQSGVNRSISEPGKKWNGTPLMEYMDSMKALSFLRKLPEIVKRLEKIELLSGIHPKDKKS